MVRVHEPLSVIDFIDAHSRSHSWTIAAALARIARAECGVLVLFIVPNRPSNCVNVHWPMSLASETKMDLRNYGIGAQILRDLGVGKARSRAPAQDAEYGRV